MADPNDRRNTNQDDGGDDGGAPLWMVTYGDLITLVLVFFVLLFSMSTLQETKMAKITKTIRENIGEPVRVIAPESDVVQSFRLNEVTFQPTATKAESFEGTEQSVQSVDEGLKFNMKDYIFFEKGEYRIKPGKNNQNVKYLDQIIDFLQGSKNKIIIRGFTSQELEDTLTLFPLRVGEGDNKLFLNGFSSERSFNMLKSYETEGLLNQVGLESEDNQTVLANHGLNRGKRLLSYLRAESVARYLTRPYSYLKTLSLEKGEISKDQLPNKPRIKPGRIRLSTGNKLLFRTDDRKLWKRNRRIEIIVLE